MAHTSIILIAFVFVVLICTHKDYPSFTYTIDLL